MCESGDGDGDGDGVGAGVGVGAEVGAEVGVGATVGVGVWAGGDVGDGVDVDFTWIGVDVGLGELDGVVAGEGEGEEDLDNDEAVCGLNDMKATRATLKTITAINTNTIFATPDFEKTRDILLDSPKSDHLIYELEVSSAFYPLLFLYFAFKNICICKPAKTSLQIRGLKGANLRGAQSRLKISQMRRRYNAS